MNSLSDEPGPVQSSAPQDAPRTSPPMPVAFPHDDPGSASTLLALREQLQELRQRFDATDAQIAGYLRDRAGSNRGTETNGEVLAHVQSCLDRLMSQFENLAAGNVPATAPKDNHEVLETLQKLADHQGHLAGKIVKTILTKMTEELDLLRFQKIMHETLATELDRREAEAESKAQRLAEEEALALAASEMEIELQDLPMDEEVPPEEDASAEAWSRAIWGPELVASPGFFPFLSELNRRLLGGDAGIGKLAGQILLFRQSPPEAKPQLLKDVGEAYYRTRLDAALPDHPFEQALIDWLHFECEQAGLPNTIEIVHIGERFDKSRHSSTTKGGAEVADVFGWVVLTEGGRVYTRASVAAH